MEFKDFLLPIQLTGSFICFVMSVVGNFLVLTVMLKRKTVRQTSANYYIISIAVADLISGAFAIPFFAYGVSCVMTCRFICWHLLIRIKRVWLFVLYSRSWHKDRTTLMFASGWLHSSSWCLAFQSTCWSLYQRIVIGQFVTRHHTSLPKKMAIKSGLFSQVCFLERRWEAFQCWGGIADTLMGLVISSTSSASVIFFCAVRGR